MCLIEEPLEYRLTVSCLQTIVEQRALQPKEPEKPAPTNVTPARRSNEGSGSFFAFDLGSLMGRDSSKSPKYPEKLLKVLDMALKKIAMGQEPKCVRCARATAPLIPDTPISDSDGRRRHSGVRPGRIKGSSGSSESRERWKISSWHSLQHRPRS